MDDGRDTVARNHRLHQRGIAHIATFAGYRLAAQAFQPLQNGRVAVGEVVQDDRLKARRAQREKGVAADESGAAGQEDGRSCGHDFDEMMMVRSSSSRCP